MTSHGWLAREQQNDQAEPNSHRTARKIPARHLTDALLTGAPDRRWTKAIAVCPTDELVPLAEKLLEVPEQLIQTALGLELQNGTVIADRVGETPCVFLAGLHRAERTIAERLRRLANGTLPWPWTGTNVRKGHCTG